MKKQQRLTQGFTLLEMMIVVAVIALLAAIALPNYTSYLIRAKRTDAMESLTEVMNQQQRFLTRNRTYTDDLADLGYTTGNKKINSDDNNYEIEASACVGGQPLTRCVLLTATARPGQGQEGDGDITFDSRGNKTWNSLPGWQHK